jgi:hypothetical protein
MDPSVDTLEEILLTHGTQLILKELMIEKHWVWRRRKTTLDRERYKPQTTKKTSQLFDERG